MIYLTRLSRQDIGLAPVVIRVLAIFLCVWLSPALADNSERGVLQVYVRDGCPHCAHAKIYLETLQREHPDVRIALRKVDDDASARDELVRVSRQAGVWPPGVPTFVFEGRVLVGFESAEMTGQAVLDLMWPQAGDDLAAIDLPLIGKLTLAEVGLPLFTLAVGLLDGFNPCAMWVLLFLLSMLVHLHDRLRMALIAGTFVLISGVIYYLFMAAWLNVFLAVGLSTALRIGLGSLAVVIGLVNAKDFFRQSGDRFTLSIPASVKPGLYARMRRIVNAGSLPLALGAAAVLAVLVNIVELLCTAGLPAMYTAILTQQELSLAAHYGYLGLYIVGYITDDALMVGTAVVALSSQKLTENTGRWLKLVSGVVMLALGVVMLLKPEWL